MRLHKKQLLAMGMAAGLSMLSVFPAMAGEWMKLDGGEFWQRRYVETDGSYPTSAWQYIDGNMYRFDENGYTLIGWQAVEGNLYYFDVNGCMVTGWRFIDNQRWHYFDESNGIMLSDLVCHGGRLDENGTWVSDRIPPKSLSVATEEDTAYWTSKLIEYNLLDKEFKKNADGTYTITCTYDQYATKPDLCNTVLAKATYAFPNGFNYSWNMVNGTFTFTVTNIGSK